MLVSIVVCAHNPGRYNDLVEAIDSLQKQTHRELEIIVVIDGSEELYEQVITDFIEEGNIEIILLEESAGVSAARNAGLAKARGKVIAFIDDDAIADVKWIETLLQTYNEYDAVAVGGKILPIWICEHPAYLPEELFWLVGVTHEGFAEERIGEIRNAFGPNMSFKREVFDKVGNFNENLGFARKGKSYIQAEEPDLALRVKRTMGKGVIYNPDAVVYHKISRSKLLVTVLLKRAFYQGYSKALIDRQKISTDAIAIERSYLKQLLFTCIPRRLARFYSPVEIQRLAILIAVIFGVGLGFMYGYIRERVTV
jgi:glycosyltransferase involved in cell wall biosynthesis